MDNELAKFIFTAIFASYFFMSGYWMRGLFDACKKEEKDLRDAIADYEKWKTQ